MSSPGLKFKLRDNREPCSLKEEGDLLILEQDREAKRSTGPGDELPMWQISVFLPSK